MRFLICIISLFFLFSLVNAEKTKKANDKTIKKTAVKAKPEKVKSIPKGVAKILEGSVVAVNTTKKTITIERKGGKYPVRLVSSTTIVGVDGKSIINIKDIKIGNVVKVNYLRNSDGTRTAGRILNRNYYVKKPEKTKIVQKKNIEKKPAVKKTVKSKDKGIAKILGGPIVAVDPGKKTITIKRKGNDYPVHISSSTVITGANGKDEIAFSELKVGNGVTINYLKNSDGSRRAEKIINKSFITKPVKKLQKKEAPKTKVTPKKKPTVKKEKPESKEKGPEKQKKK